MINKNKDLKIAIIGLGYVGLPLALEFAKKRNVIGFDINKKRVNELKSGIECADNFQGRGRKKAEEKNPKLLEQIKQIVDSEAQADPAMNSERMYIKITANSVREQLKKLFNYKEEELPVRYTISCKLNQMGYSLKKVRKTIPKKRSPKQMKSLKI